MSAPPLELLGTSACHLCEQAERLLLMVERATETDEQIVNAFAAHLDLERGRSEHTVRAYRREAAARAVAARAREDEDAPRWPLHVLLVAAALCLLAFEWVTFHRRWTT